MAAALAHQPRDTALGQCGQCRIHIKPFAAHRYLDRLDAQIGQRVVALGRRRAAMQDPGGDLARGRRQPPGQRQRQAGVGDDPDGRAVAKTEITHIQHRVVGARGARADQDSVGPGAHQVDAPARLGAGDPPAFAGPCGNPSVQRCGQLEQNMRAPAFDPAEEAPIDGPRLVGQQAGLDRDPGLA